MSPDLATSIKARLLAQAKRQQEEFERTLTRYAAERLLYRLGASRLQDRCILKGASLLAVWLTDPHRATRDVDLLATGPATEAAVRGMVEEICATACPEDAVRFDLSGLVLSAIRAEQEYPGVRARFHAFLGTARIAVQLDVGFGDALAVDPVVIDVPPMLEALPRPRLRAYPPEASIAEKFEAMVKLGLRSSRMKDFHDVWALPRALPFDGPVLQQSIAACFARRGTPLQSVAPEPLTPAFYAQPELVSRWRSYLAASRPIGVPRSSFSVLGEEIIRFLGPVQLALTTSAGFVAKWAPGGPWLA